MSQYARCEICNKDAECTCCTFGKNGSITNYVTPTMVVSFERMCDLHICDDCGRENGKSPTKLWVVLIVSALAYLGSIPLLSNAFESSGPDLPALAVLGFLFLFAGMITQLITVSIMATRQATSRAGMFGWIMLSLVPGAGLLLLIRKKAIDRRYRAVSALKPIAEAQFATTEADHAELKQKIENGEETDPEKLRAFKREESLKQEAQAQNEAQVRKGNISGALVGIAITVIIALQGCDAYGSGRGYMELFHSIRLSSTAFYLIIAGLIVWDIVSLVSAMRRK